MQKKSTHTKRIENQQRTRKKKKITGKNEENTYAAQTVNAEYTHTVRLNCSYMM